MKRYIKSNSVSNKLPVRIDNFLQDMAQTYGTITYSDIINFGEYADADSKKSVISDVKELKSILKDMEDLDLYEACAEDADVRVLCQRICRTILSV